jgi:hypothetical protein
VAGKLHRWITTWVILASLAGCDNVEWGGAELRLVPPAVRDSSALALGEDGLTPPSFPLPEDPVLLIAHAIDDELTFVPVAEISDSGLQPLPQDAEFPGFDSAWVASAFPAGTRLSMIAGGAAVGTFVVEAPRPATGWCEPRFALQGRMELTRSIANPSRLLAQTMVPASVAAAVHEAPNHNYDQRVAGIELAIETIAQVGARWPESVLATRQDMRAFDLGTRGRPAIAASFVFRDSLAIGPPESDAAYSLMVIAEDRGGSQNNGYRQVFTWYRPVADGRKATARVYEHADVDGDGDHEIVLEVFGVAARSAVVLDRDGDIWQEAFASPCVDVDAETPATATATTIDG